MSKKIEGMAELEEGEDGKLKVIFAPGAFDHFDGTQEELDEAMKMITEMINSGDIHEMSQPVDMEQLMEEDPEVAESLMRALAQLEEDGTVSGDQRLLN